MKSTSPDQLHHNKKKNGEVEMSFFNNLFGMGQKAQQSTNQLANLQNSQSIYSALGQQAAQANMSKLFNNTYSTSSGFIPLQTVIYPHQDIWDKLAERTTYKDQEPVVGENEIVMGENFDIEWVARLFEHNLDFEMIEESLPAAQVGFKTWYHFKFASEETVSAARLLQ